MNKTRIGHTIVRDLGFSLLTEGTILKIKAIGYSMYPTVKPGSVIFIEPLTNNSDPALGDIIAWKRESGFVVHRLVRTERKGNETLYYTRGDSCALKDKPVTWGQIAGKVIRLEDRKQKYKDEEKLRKKPCYFVNRIIVWFLIKSKRVRNFILIKPPGSLTMISFIVIFLWYFVMPGVLQSSDFMHICSPGKSLRPAKDYFSAPEQYTGTYNLNESEI